MEISIRETAELVAAAVGFTGAIRWDTSMPNGQPRRSVDPSRAAELFGFEAQVPLTEGSSGPLPGSETRGTAVRTPDRLLLLTVGAQWIVTVAVALIASRTGSVFGDVGSVTATIGSASGVAHGALPDARGPLYPLLLAPLAGLTVRAGAVASVVTTVHVVVLGPLASYCLLELGRRIAGRMFALLAAAVWLLGPIVVVPLFVGAYRDTYVDNVLPAFYGLTVGPAYLAMVLSLASAMLALRAVAGAARAAFAAGLLAAAAIACLPVGAGIAVGVVLALVVARRWRGVGEALAGIAAGLAPTLIWRHRALETPAFTLGHPSWNGFQGSMANIREFFYSNRMLQWLPVAGAIGMFRLSRPAAALTAGWVAAATIVGVATPTSFDKGRFFLDLIPAWPAYALLVAAIPALVPTLVRRLGARVEGESPAGDVARPAVAVLLVLIVGVAGVLAATVGR